MDFNKKYRELAKKNYDQLLKEFYRRGLSRRQGERESEMIVEIIAYDAYNTGRSEILETLKTKKPIEEVAKKSKPITKEHKKYWFEDDGGGIYTYYLTEDQVRVFELLIDKGLLDGMLKPDDSKLWTTI